MAKQSDRENSQFVALAGLPKRRGGVRPGAGRPPQNGAAALIMAHIYLTPEQWAWLENRIPGNKSAAVRDCVDTMQKFFPNLGGQRAASGRTVLVTPYESLTAETKREGGG